MSDVDIRFYLLLAWRRLPWLVLSTVLGGVLGIAVALFIVPTYRATTRLLIDSPTIPAQLARTTVTTSAAEQLSIVRERLTTRDNLLGLADKLHIYENVSPSPRPAEIVEDMRARILFDQFLLDPNGSGASIISISFDATDPSLAANVANSLASLLVSASTTARASRADDTIQFFERERARLGDDLGQVEAKILAFKQANSDSLPDSLEFRRTELSSAQEQLVQLRREEAALYARRINLGRFGGQLADGGATAPQSPLRQMLMELERALVQQRTLFTEDSPTIVGLKQRIADVQERLRAEFVEPAPDQPAEDPAVEIDRADIGERLKAIQTEKTQLSGKIDELVASIGRTPSSELSLNELTRDRDNLQLQYNAAVAKLGDALIGREIETGVGLDTISVVEEAEAPTRAIGVRRRILAAAGVLFGGGLGFGIIVLLELLNQSIRRPSEVTALLESPLLGTIPMLAPPRSRTPWRAPNGVELKT